MGYEFKPGEYTTRGGTRAIVRFKVQEPHVANHPLRGEALGGDGKWFAASWTPGGRHWGTTESVYDLLPQKQYAYCNRYPRSCGSWYPSVEEAAKAADESIVGRLRCELKADGSLNWDTLTVLPVDGI